MEHGGHKLNNLLAIANVRNYASKTSVFYRSQIAKAVKAIFATEILKKWAGSVTATVFKLTLRDTIAPFIFAIT